LSRRTTNAVTLIDGTRRKASARRSRQRAGAGRPCARADGWGRPRRNRASGPRLAQQKPGRARPADLKPLSADRAQFFYSPQSSSPWPSCSAQTAATSIQSVDPSETESPNSSCRRIVSGTSRDTDLLVVANTAIDIPHSRDEAYLLHRRFVGARLWKQVTDFTDLTFRLLPRGKEFLAEWIASRVL
jgi:hypothetical protein